MSRLKLWIRDGLSLLVWVGRTLLRCPPPAGLRILLYHTIAEMTPRADRWRMSVPPALLAAHLRWLRQHGYAIVSFGDALEMLRGARPMPAKVVAVTFDDGFQDTLVRAAPILQAEQVPATMFVVPRDLDLPQPFPWLDHREAFSRPLSWEELQTLADHPLVSIGSHAWTHRRLSELPLTEQDNEMAQSKSTLETRLHKPVNWFAYPYGDKRSFSEETIACLKRTGFAAACTNIMGANRVGDSLWTLRRTRVGWEDHLWRFRLKMAGVYDWLDSW